jgi:hypothetical protein
MRRWNKTNNRQEVDDDKNPFCHCDSDRSHDLIDILFWGDTEKLALEQIRINLRSGRAWLMFWERCEGQILPYMSEKYEKN